MSKVVLFVASNLTTNVIVLIDFLQDFPDDTEVDIQADTSRAIYEQ